MSQLKLQNSTVLNIQRAMIKYNGIRYVNDFVNANNIVFRIPISMKCKYYYNELLYMIEPTSFYSHFN